MYIPVHLRSAVARSCHLHALLHALEIALCALCPARRCLLKPLIHMQRRDGERNRQHKMSSEEQQGGWQQEEEPWTHILSLRMELWRRATTRENTGVETKCPTLVYDYLPWTAIGSGVLITWHLVLPLCHLQLELTHIVMFCFTASAPYHWLLTEMSCLPIKLVTGQALHS